MLASRRSALPLYDYECPDCGHEFELRQGFHEAGQGTCPMCSASARRKFHAVPVIYKGSGFYTTDYGRPKTPPSDNHKEKGDKEGKKEDKETKAKESKATAKKDSSSTSEVKAEAATKKTSEVAA